MIKLTVNPDNPRTIDKKDFEKLKKSVQSFTKMLEIRPIAYDENKVIWGGNQRYVALEMLVNEGLVEPKDEYFKEMVGYTLDEKKEFAIRDNVEFGKHDWDILMGSEAWADAPLDEWGLDPAEWTGKEVIEDDAPEVSDEPAVSKRGEIYQLGKHRVMCGDSTKIEDVEKLVDGKKADMVVTSPPYWLGFEYEQERNYQEVRSHISNVARNVCLMTDGRVVINTGNIASLEKSMKVTGNKEVVLLIDWWRDEMAKSGYLLRNLRIWAKEGQIRPNANSDIVDMHWEYIGEFLDGGFSANFYKDGAVWRGQSKIGKWANKWSMSGIWIDVKGNARSNNHVASFPVEIPWRLILLYSNNGDMVLEPYLGSGTTLIACEQTNRICYGMELDEKYLDVVRKRWAKYVYPDRREDEWQTLTPSIDKL